MQPARWRILLTGGAIVLLVGLTAGLVQAQDPSPPAADPSAQPDEADDPWDELLGDRFRSGDRLRQRDPGQMRERLEKLRDQADRLRDKADRLRGAGMFGHLGRLDRLVHAEALIDLPERGLTRFTLDVGSLTAIGTDGSLTLVRTDGVTVTVATDDETRIHKDREKVEVSALAVGDRVVAIAAEQDGSLVARFVRVLPTADDSADSDGSEASPTPSP